MKWDIRCPKRKGFVEFRIKILFRKFSITSNWNSEKEKSRDFEFFISTTYNFQNKIWDSDGIEINANRWAKDDSNKRLYPILNDRLLLVLDSDAVHYDFQSNDCNSFRMIPFSSNGFDFNLSNNSVFFVCNETYGLKLELLLDSEQSQCKSLFIPQSDNDFADIVRNMENDVYNKGSSSVKFWTDYQRLNETHFWSDIANTWWSQCKSYDVINPSYIEFRPSVSIDRLGYIKNAYSRDNSGCICVGKVLARHSPGLWLHCKANSIVNTS